MALARGGRRDVIVRGRLRAGLRGSDLLGALGAGGVRTPGISLSAKDAEVDKSGGCDTGADDYLSKPFGMGELLARIRARLRGGAEEEEETLEPPLLPKNKLILAHYS